MPQDAGEGGFDRTIDGTAPGAAPVQATQLKTSSLAIVGFILSIIPLACINLVGVILGVIALVRISDKPNELKGKGLAIAAIVVGIMWMVVAILAAIAIPNFMKFQARAKQSEAKANLVAIYTAEQTKHAEDGAYVGRFTQLNWRPETGARYTYYIGQDSVSAGGTAQPLPGEVETYVRKDGFRAVAVANIDGDDTLDVWVIDEKHDLQNLSNDSDH